MKTYLKTNCSFTRNRLLSGLRFVTAPLLTCLAALFISVTTPAAASGLSANADAPGRTFITFDAPSAGTGPGQGTEGIHINPAGAITGYYLDSGDVFHGYVRARDGTFTTFDAPGAGTGPFEGTLAFSINPAGATAGIVRDANIVRHGFVRAPNSAITTFDVPGAGTGPLQGTRANNINPAGAIAGFSTDANDVNHGFVRTSNGRHYDV